MAQWESKREQKKQERDARVLAAHRAHPDLADADARLSKHALDCVKRSLHGDVTGLDDADVLTRPCAKNGVRCLNVMA